MEEMKREFAGKLYRKACEIAEFYEEQMDSEDDNEVFDIEECLVELVFDEMIFCQAAVSRTYFATLPTDNLYIMSEARKELPFKPKQEDTD